MRYSALALALFPSLSLSFSVIAATNSDVETIEVTGRAQQFYLDSSTRVGTKTESDIMQIPLSVQVLTRQLIADQAARDITDLY